MSANCNIKVYEVAQAGWITVQTFLRATGKSEGMKRLRELRSSGSSEMTERLPVARWCRLCFIKQHTPGYDTGKYFCINLISLS